MTDRHKQEQVGTEVTYQIFSEFLQNTPPNQLAHISDLAISQNVGPYPSIEKKINAPELRLHCPHESCNGVRFFRCIDLLVDRKSLDHRTISYLYVRYQCSNCKETLKVYSLAAKIDTIGKLHGECYKYGEYPPYGPPVPPRLIKLIGPDRDIFLQGRRCENQGLGIGAFAYYRRVVENQKNRILEEIIKVSEKMGAPEDKINTLRGAIEETQFSKALDMAKDVMPENLLINGQNPIRLLHGVLSHGVHELPDEQCLDLASSVRVVLGKLSEKLSDILKDEAEVKGAISTLMNYKNS